MLAIIKVLITAGVVVAASELARRSSLLGAVIIALPSSSILAIVWLYHDTHDVAKVSEFTSGILWMIIPSLLFFLALPLLLQHGIKFWPALLLSCGIMAVSYRLFVFIRS